MVQEFHVVRCFRCQSFQVQQVKKVNRWSCKLCGEKQSLLKEFGRGSGADCRRHVQKLNAMRGAVMKEQEQHTWSLWQQVGADGEDEPEEQRDDQVTHPQVSCWSKYLYTPEEAEPEEEVEENVLMDRQQLHGNNMIDRKRKRRDGWTDRRGHDTWTPAQSNGPTATNLNHTSVRNTSVNSTSPPRKRSVNPPSVRNTSVNSTSPPRKRSVNPPSVRNTSVNSTSPPRKRSVNPPSVRNTSVNSTSPPRKRSVNPPSVRNTSVNSTSPPRKRSVNPPSVRNTSVNSTSPPRKRSMNPPSVSTGAVSKWARFLSSDCQVTEEGEEPSVSKQSQSVGRASPLSTNDIITLPLPSTKPRPLLPVSSLFQTGEDFNFGDEDFLINT